jgi:hypothetical protein
VAVAAQRDPDRRPADAPDDAIEEGQDLPAARAFGGTQHRRDQPAAGVEDHDRLEAVLVIMGIGLNRSAVLVLQPERLLTIVT